MSDVVKFPGPKAPDAAEPLLIGPFTAYKVQVEGRIIPRLAGYPQEGGRVTLIVDGRFAVDFPGDIANQAAWLLANALAVGEGYSNLAALTKEQPFAPVGMQVGPT